MNVVGALKWFGGRTGCPRKVKGGVGHGALGTSRVGQGALGRSGVVGQGVLQKLCFFKGLTLGYVLIEIHMIVLLRSPTFHAGGCPFTNFETIECI